MICLDNGPKTLFGTSISAIGIGVMLFYQILVGRLDIGGGGIGVNAERFESLGFQRLQFSLARLLFGGTGAGLLPGLLLYGTGIRVWRPAPPPMEPKRVTAGDGRPAGHRGCGRSPRTP